MGQSKQNIGGVELKFQSRGGISIPIASGFCWRLFVQSNLSCLFSSGEGCFFLLYAFYDRSQRFFFGAGEGFRVVCKLFST